VTSFLAAVDVGSLIGPIINVGAVGACLVILAIYYVKKDKKYDQRIDGQLAAEQAFRKEMADVHEKYRNQVIELTEKYRLALEKFSQTLDAVLRVIPKRGNE